MSRFVLPLLAVGLTISLLAFAANGGWRPGQALEQALLFHPAPYPKSWLPPPNGFPVEDVWLQSADGDRLHAWWVAQPCSRGAILYLHGNAGNVSHWLASAYMLSKQLGESLLIVDYPGYGRSTGTPSEEGCYAAARAARDWLVNAKQVAQRDVILFGQSLGGGVATQLAMEQPPRALVLVKTFTSIPDVAKKSWISSASASLVKNRFASIDKVGKCRCPVFVAHGDQDRVIPLAQGQQLYKAARQPKQFLLLKGSGHNDLLPMSFYGELRGFLTVDSGAP
ncbi:MAG: alpha/beta hydrolase [Gemmataceae bacterium]